MTVNDKSSIKCIAVDDEPIALNIIRTHAKEISYLDLCKEFTSANEALLYLKDHETDIVFLDINMPDLSGLEMAEMLKGNIKVIFTTAHSEFAVKGFEIDAMDYLLKPISFERFKKACERAREQLKNNTQFRSIPGTLYLKDGYNWIRINTEELIYVEASDNYVVFNESGKKTLVRITLAEALDKLSAYGFVRVHKSFGIAVSRIQKIEKKHIIVAEQKIPLSSGYRKNVLPIS